MINDVEKAINIIIEELKENGEVYIGGLSNKGVKQVIRELNLNKKIFVKKVNDWLVLDGQFYRGHFIAKYYNKYTVSRSEVANYYRNEKLWIDRIIDQETKKQNWNKIGEDNNIDDFINCLEN